MPAARNAPAYPELAAELARQNLAHEALARTVGRATQTISQIVRGRLTPSLALQDLIADALGRSVEELFATPDADTR